jgi:hypothetical protein
MADEYNTSQATYGTDGQQIISIPPPVAASQPAVISSAGGIATDVPANVWSQIVPPAQGQRTITNVGNLTLYLTSNSNEKMGGGYMLAAGASVTIDSGNGWFASAGDNVVNSVVQAIGRVSVL